MDKHEDIKNVLVKMGQKLGFLAFDEIGSGQERTAWTDVVWFDSRIKGDFFAGIVPLDQQDRKREEGKPSLDTDFVLPIIGFEIERVRSSTEVPVKNIKGSISNLETLGIQVGVIVIYAPEGLDMSQNLNEAKRKVLRYLTDMKPRIRIIVITEKDIIKIEQNVKAIMEGFGVKSGLI